MAHSGGISGVAVMMTGIGGLLIYAGIKNVKVRDALQAILRGQKPAVPKPITTSVSFEFGPSGGGGGVVGANNSVAGGNATGTAIANKALSYVGRVPYVWGGTTPAGWDCSGMVYYILNTDFGMPMTRMTTYGFDVWNGASNIPRSQAAAGDLVMYNGHMGIAINNTDYVSAQNPQLGTGVSKIDWAPYTNPVTSIRRLNSVTNNVGGLISV